MASLHHIMRAVEADIKKTIPISIENGKKGLNKSFNINLAVSADDSFFTANSSVTLSRI